jgi:hypothetical protein
MPQQGQPDLPAIWDFDAVDVGALEAGGIAPGNIINVPNTFQLVTNISNDLPLSVLLHTQPGTIQYRAERLEDNTVTNLATTAFVVAGNGVFNPATVVTTVTSAAFSSGPGGNLDVGTYMLTAIVSMDNAGFRQVVAGFVQNIIRVLAA